MALLVIAGVVLSLVVMSKARKRKRARADVLTAAFADRTAGFPRGVGRWDGRAHL